MPISELGFYRLRALDRAVNETVDAALQKQEKERARAELLQRRAQVAQGLAKFNPNLPNREDVYQSGVNALRSLPIGTPEGNQAAALVNQSVANYLRFNPAKTTTTGSKEWVDATETKDEKRYPLTLEKPERPGTFGILMQQLQGGQPTGVYKYDWRNKPRPAKSTGGIGTEAKSAVATKKRIAQITKANQELGQKMRDNSAKTEANVIKFGIERDSPEYKASYDALRNVNEGLAQQIKDNETLLGSLNREIGGAYGQTTTVDYPKMSEGDLFTKAQGGDAAAYQEAKRRGLVK